MTTYLRSKQTGVIFEAHKRLVGRPEFEVLTEQEAYPERFAPVDLSAREQKVDIAVPEAAAVPPPEVMQETVSNASVKFAGPNAKRVKKDTPIGVV